MCWHWHVTKEEVTPEEWEYILKLREEDLKDERSFLEKTLDKLFESLIRAILILIIFIFHVRYIHIVNLRK